MKSPSLLLSAFIALTITGCSAAGPVSPLPRFDGLRQPSVPAPVYFTRVVSPDRQALPADQQVQTMVSAINAERTKAGLHALSPEPSLMQAAQAYARTLARKGDIDHLGPDGSRPAQRAERAGYKWGFIGENLAAGQLDPAETVGDWLTSKGHRENMLDRRPVHLGVGYVARSGDDFGHYWVLLVGSPRGRA